MNQSTSLIHESLSPENMVEYISKGIGENEIKIMSLLILRLFIVIVILCLLLLIVVNR